MTPETHAECKKHLERAFEEAFRRFPGDPYRALSWLLQVESSMPTRRADFLLTHFAPLRKLAARYLTSAAPPAPAAASAIGEVLEVLRKPLAYPSDYSDAQRLVDAHAITATELIEHARKKAWG